MTNQDTKKRVLSDDLVLSQGYSLNWLSLTHQRVQLTIFLVLTSIHTLSEKNYFI